MVNYFYKWIPIFIVGTILLLGLPWLGLIAVMVVALVLLGALGMLGAAIAWVIGMLSQKISDRWHGRSGAKTRDEPRTVAGPLRPDRVIHTSFRRS
jgi:hypothetical protein